MIKPTIGRIVHYYPSPGAREQAAIITDVHDERCVNLTVLLHDGSPDPKTSVALRQPDDEIPSQPWCEWMPYQVKKAHGSESGEAAAGTETV